MKLPVTYEKVLHGDWDIGISSRGREFVDSHGNTQVELRWLTVATRTVAGKPAAQIYSRAPKEQFTREVAYALLLRAILQFELEEETSHE